MSRLVRSVIYLALGIAFVRADPAFAERRVALVIGNSDYQYAPALPNPQRDAQAMAAMFQKAGFDVVSAQTDAGVSQFKRAIAQFEDEAGRSDIAVVYYSGYGIAIQGVNYLAPVDAKLAGDRDAVTAAVTLDSLAKAVDGAKRLRLVILDASRGDPFATAIETAAPHVTGGGLAEPEPKPGALIAYAAIAGSPAEEGGADHSTYTSALLRNLFTPGLDIRLAFGRILVDVLKKTSKRQSPQVYGSLGGGNIALVPAPADRPSIDLEGEKTDYGVVQQIGLARAYEVFLVQHPTGFYSTAARQQLRIVEAQPPKPASATPGPVATLEQPPPDTAPPGKLPEMNSPGQIEAAQQELTRLGCYSGAADGSLDAATRAAIQLYQSARGQNPANDMEITDDFIADLKQQSAGVCPIACPAGKIAEGRQCVDAGKSVVPQKGGDKQTKAPKPSIPKQEARPIPPPRTAAQAPSGGGHSAPTPGVGF
jgi:peptidoglycan hydrolase-like protein with peptidoglycan-binding domain